MTNKELFITNNIQSKHLKKKFLRQCSNNFQQIISQANSEIHNPKKTFNILNKNFKLNFTINDLKKFKKFQTIVLIGMGGSILGAEAIYNYFQNKINIPTWPTGHLSHIAEPFLPVKVPQMDKINYKN